MYSFITNFEPGGWWEKLLQIWKFDQIILSDLEQIYRKRLLTEFVYRRRRDSLRVIPFLFFIKCYLFWRKEIHKSDEWLTNIDVLIFLIYTFILSNSCCYPSFLRLLSLFLTSRQQFIVILLNLNSTKLFSNDMQDTYVLLR